MYDYEYKTSDGRRTSKLYFIFWAPVNCNQRQRIAYSHALEHFRGQFAGVKHERFSEEEDVEELLSEEVTG